MLFPPAAYLILLILFKEVSMFFIKAAVFTTSVCMLFTPGWGWGVAGIVSLCIPGQYKS